MRTMRTKRTKGWGDPLGSLPNEVKESCVMSVESFMLALSIRLLKRETLVLAHMYRLVLKENFAEAREIFFPAARREGLGDERDVFPSMRTMFSSVKGPAVPRFSTGGHGGSHWRP